MTAGRPPRFVTRAFDFSVDGGHGGPAQADGRTLEGYAAVFDTPTRIDSWEGTFDERIAPGAFKRTLNSGRLPVMQFDHGKDVRTGSVPIGAIRDLREDSRGLHVQAELFDNPVVDPIRQAISGGAITGMSFRFKVNDDRWTKQAGDVDLRTIREVELFELGPVVFPAYEATSVGVRSLLAHLDDHERTALIWELGHSARPARGLTPGQRATTLREFELHTLGG